MSNSKSSSASKTKTNRTARVVEVRRHDDYTGDDLRVLADAIDREWTEQSEAEFRGRALALRAAAEVMTEDQVVEEVWGEEHHYGKLGDLNPRDVLGTLGNAGIEIVERML